MRDMTRRERAAMSALESAIEHEPALRPVLVSDYAHARKDLKDVRRLRDALDRRLLAATRQPDEPGSRPDVRCERPWTPAGSRSDLVPGDGAGAFGDEDHTGFADGCVF